VQLLAEAEAEGIELRNCPAYIREWITKGANEQLARRVLGDGSGRLESGLTRTNRTSQHSTNGRNFMKRTYIRSRRHFLTASSILGVAAAFNPGTIRTVFANSNIKAEEESMTATIAVQDSSTLATGNSDGLQIPAVGFFTREEEMRHA